MIVFLGRYNLSTPYEKGQVERKIRQIIIHPDWLRNDEKWDADIAILTLTSAVRFTSLIQPVCMSNSMKVENQVKGTVVR